MTEKKDESVTFETLGEAINYVEDSGKAAHERAQGFAQAFQELTGMEPQRTVNALDVVKICYALYGEPKGD